MHSDPDDLDAAGVLAAAESVVHRRRAAEVEDLLLVARWAGLHSADPRRGPRGGTAWDHGGDRLVRVGGEGTPEVQELCLPELAIARQVHTLAVRAAMADVLDLQHRLPRTWAVVRALAGEVWVARKVATLSRGLSRAAVGLVDAAVADAIGGESPSRVLAVAQAKVIEADLAGHRERLESERRRRFVSLSRTDDVGLRHVIARVEAGDAVWIDATVQRVAEVLRGRPDLRPGTPASLGHDELRALAFGWLAHPADLLELLGGVPGPGAEKVRPRATVYVHLHHDVLAGTAAGVARVESMGPLLLDQVRTLVGHTRVTLKPVIDLADQVAVDRYEFPEAVRERIFVRCPGEAFPHATRVSRQLDLDHVAPYDERGGPGQTATDNAAPLGRTAHRAKTHLRYRLTRSATGEYVWSSPHGLHRVVDERGTHVLDAAEAAALRSDDPVDRALARLVYRHRSGALA